MRFCHTSLTLAFLAVFAVMTGCQGPIMTGGFNQSPYRAYGVDGPGPGVVPDNYQATAMNGPAMQAPMGPIGPVAPAMMPMEAAVPNEAAMMMAHPMPPMAPMMMRPMGPTSQVNFLGLESMVVNWDAKAPGTFDSEPLVCPAMHDFAQGNVYRLKLSSIPGRPGKELYPTLEIAPTMARTQAFLAHNSVPVEFTDNDFDQVLSGNFITKVIYLPNAEYQGLAMAGVGTLVNTQLEPGVDPIVEASNRGAILAVIRMGNKDLSGSVAERQRQGGMPGMPGMMTPPGFYPVNGSAIPQNMISGVNIAPYGTPMTKTTTGIPGPPQLPQGMHSPNRYPVVRAEPIPAPPKPIGVEPHNVMFYPHYTSQMQGPPMPVESGPALAPQQVQP